MTKSNSIAPLIEARPWTKARRPRSVLAIRLQAMGDTIGTLPYLQHLRKSLPADTRLDFLTREETDSIPRNIFLFDKVWSIGGGRNFKLQCLHTLMLLPRLAARRYDAVIDLQNNLLSRMVRTLLWPEAWSAYDRFSPISGAERYRLTIEAAGLGSNQADGRFHLRDADAGLGLLLSHGWKPGQPLIVLNPAGAFETRHWPLENYVEFARLWMRDVPTTRFLLMGTEFIREKATLLQERLGGAVVNLVGETSTFEAFSILQRTQFMLSEDSGLMHMAWLSGIPTLALFGSTRSDWSRPLGKHTLLLDSSDLSCGGCMESVCRFGDVHCLSRYSAAFVYEKARMLLNTLNPSHALVQA